MRAPLRKWKTAKRTARAFRQPPLAAKETLFFLSFLCFFFLVGLVGKSAAHSAWRRSGRLKTCVCPGGIPAFSCYEEGDNVVFTPAAADGGNNTIYIAVGASVGGCLCCILLCCVVWRMLPDAQRDDIESYVYSSRREGGGNVVQLKEDQIL